MNPAVNQPTILCLSHLAWEEGLFQRPQQVMSRMAGLGYNVLYAGCVGWKKSRVLKKAGWGSGGNEGLRFINLAYSPFKQRLDYTRRVWTASQIPPRLWDNCPALIVWVYHPGLLALARDFHYDLLVYDLMDHFAAFDKAGSRATEQDLLETANLVFTGGKSLHETTLQKISAKNPPPVCLPSGIDLAHFSEAANPGNLPIDLAALPHSILGYFGAVDERIDWNLLTILGKRFSTGSIVLIGPLLTMPPPLPPNIHLLGARPYSELPNYLRGFDVCLLPFRTTELVAHISPTKTPEYLAGGKPVVSTMIPDVAADYGDVVEVTTDEGSFVEACGQAIASPPTSAALMAAAQRARTWDEIATIMAGHLRKALDAK